MNSNLQFHGAFTLILEKTNGDVETIYKENLIVSSGFDFISDVMFNNTQPGPARFIALGTGGATAAAEGQTSLIAEISDYTVASTRPQGAYAHTISTKTATVSHTFGPNDGTGALNEAGLFNASSTGIMLDRVVFPEVNKGVDDTLTVTFTLTLS